MKIVKRLPLCVGLTFGLSAHAFAAGDTVSETAQKAGEAAMTSTMSALGKNTVEVKFDKGSTKLSEAEVTALRSLIKSAHEKGKIEKVYIGAWADKAFAEGKAASYTDADKDLAKERAKAVKNVLDEVGARDIEVVNLAEKPNWFEQKLGTEEAKIKDTVAGKDITKGKEEANKEDREMAAVGHTMKSEGGASKAVVIVQHQVAH